MKDGWMDLFVTGVRRKDETKAGVSDIQISVSSPPLPPLVSSTLETPQHGNMITLTVVTVCVCVCSSVNVTHTQPVKQCVSSLVFLICTQSKTHTFVPPHMSAHTYTGMFNGL